MGPGKALRAALVLLTALIVTGPVAADTYYGFASGATGGTGQPLYTITSCSNGIGLGTLRDAVSQGNRYIVSSVACSPPVDFGTSYVYVRSNTTLDLTSAPGVGYQYVGTLNMDGPKCSPTCHNVVFKGLQCRRTTELPYQMRCLAVERGAYDVVIDHSTFEKCADDCITVSSNTSSGYADSHNVTISRNLFNHPLRSCCDDETGAETTGLIYERPRRVSFLLNLVYTAARRNLWTGYSTSLNATDTTYDMRYNLLWNIGGKFSRDGGPLMREGVRANVYRNYFKAKDGLSVNAQKREIIACKPSGTASEDASACRSTTPLALLYTAENVSHEGWSDHLNAKGNTATPLAAGSVPVGTVCEAVNAILADVGAPYKSASDRAALANISIPSCPGSTPAPDGR